MGLKGSYQSSLGCAPEHVSTSLGRWMLRDKTAQRQLVLHKCFNHQESF